MSLIVGSRTWSLLPFAILRLLRRVLAPHKVAGGRYLLAFLTKVAGWLRLLNRETRSNLQRVRLIPNLRVERMNHFTEGPQCCSPPPHPPLRFPSMDPFWVIQNLPSTLHPPSPCFNVTIVFLLEPVHRFDKEQRSLPLLAASSLARLASRGRAWDAVAVVAPALSHIPEARRWLDSLAGWR